MQLTFVTSNKFKASEAEQILAPASVHVNTTLEKIEELQTIDTTALVKHKALSAYRLIGRPLFVEHTGLYLDRMNGFPGGLTQIFWDTLKADLFAELFGKPPDNRVTAKTVIGYVDGRRFHFFSGQVPGVIPGVPRGNREFQWDCVFVPDGHKETFAEMGNKKNNVSMRRKALDLFLQFLLEAK